MIAITKNTLRELILLSKKKNRIESGRTFIEGARLIEEALKSGLLIEELFISETKFRKLSGVLPEIFSPYLCSLVRDEDFARIADTEQPQGIGALIQLPTKTRSLRDINQAPVLYLDRIADPGNLGTIFRTAIWFGFKDIILSDGCVDPYNAKVLRSSMGGVFSIRFYKDPAERAITLLKEQGYIVASAHLDGTPLAEFKPVEGPIALIIGSEAHGVHPALLAVSDHKVFIPGTGEIESLNAAVSAGILLAAVAKPVKK